MGWTRFWGVAVAITIAAAAPAPAASQGTTLVVPAGSVRYLHDASGNLTRVVDTSIDVNNCGQLGAQCPAVTAAGGETVCSRGACGAMVNGAFLDFWTDPAHCGPSLQVCLAPQDGVADCVSGACGFHCGAGFAASGTSCVDLWSDPANCGHLNHACDADATCSNGRCVKQGVPVVYGVNGVSAPGVAFRSPMMSGIRIEGTGLDAVLGVWLEDWGPDTASTLETAEPSAPFFRGQLPTSLGMNPNTSYWKISPTSLVIPQAALGYYATLPTLLRFQAHEWFKVGLVYVEHGVENRVLIDVAISFDDRAAPFPAPVISGVSALEVRYFPFRWSYDPASGFLPLRSSPGCGVDPMVRRPSAVLAAWDPLMTEFPVYGVTSTGVYLDVGLDPHAVGRFVFGGGNEAPDAVEVTLVYDDTEASTDSVNLESAAPGTPLNCTRRLSVPQIGGLILRGSNLFSDGTMNALTVSGMQAPGEFDAVFLEDRIAIRPRRFGRGYEYYQGSRAITGIVNSETLIEYLSPRGNATSPWAIRWIAAPTITSIGPAPFVTYDRPMTISGGFFTSLTDVAFSWGSLTEHLTPSATSPPAPGQFHVADENTIELVVSSSPGTVPRGLGAICRPDGTSIQEVFPGSRAFSVTNAAGTATAAVSAVDPNGPQYAVEVQRCAPAESVPSGAESSSSPPRSSPAPDPGSVPLFPYLPATGNCDLTSGGCQ